MIQIRKGLFETNSSSSHSLVVSKNSRGYNYNLPVNERGRLTIRFGEYGLGPEVLYTPYEKLCYWMTEYASEFWNDWNPEYEGKSFTDKLQIFEGKREIKEAIKTIKKLCKDVKKVDFESPDESDSYYSFGYIDHDSEGLIRGADLKETVFNDSCIIIIDNDNSNYFDPWVEDEDYGGNTARDPEELFENDMNKSTWSFNYDNEGHITNFNANLTKR